jgi:SAM-dependent methyltransferase
VPDRDEIRAEIRAAHDAIATEYGAYRPASYGEWSRRRLARLLREAFDLFVANPGKARVLDAGCGNGQFALLFGRWGVGEIVGADFSLRMLTTARQRMATAAEGNARDTPTLTRFYPLCTDLERLALRSETFDLAYCYGVMEHLDHPDRVLMELARTVRPGGVLMVDFPRWGSLSHLTFMVFGLSPRHWGRAGRWNLRRRLDFAGKARLYRYFSRARVDALCAGLPGWRVVHRTPTSYNYMVGPPMYPLLGLGRLFGPGVYTLSNALLRWLYPVPAGELVVLRKEKGP